MFETCCLVGPDSPQWLIAFLFRLAVLSFAVCPALSNLVGCGLIFAVGVIYGLMGIGRRYQIAYEFFCYFCTSVGQGSISVDRCYWRIN